MTPLARPARLWLRTVPGRPSFLSLGEARRWAWAPIVAALLTGCGPLGAGSVPTAQIASTLKYVSAAQLAKNGIQMAPASQAAAVTEADAQAVLSTDPFAKVPPRDVAFADVTLSPRRCSCWVFDATPDDPQHVLPAPHQVPDPTGSFSPPVPYTSSTPTSVPSPPSVSGGQLSPFTWHLVFVDAMTGKLVAAVNGS